MVHVLSLEVFATPGFTKNDLSCIRIIFSLLIASVLSIVWYLA